MKSYPLGIQTFEKIIEGEFLYIDKTQDIYKLIRKKSTFR
ncbi:MAG: AAA family ATPase [Chitinophagales bacterium]